MQATNEHPLAAEQEHLRQIAAHLRALSDQAYHPNEDGSFDYIPRDSEKPQLPLGEVLDNLAAKNDAYSLDLLDIRNPQTKQFVLDAVGKKLQEFGFFDECAFLGAGAEAIALSARHENNSIYRIVIKLTPQADEQPRPDVPFMTKPFFDEVIAESAKIGKLRLSIEPMMLVLHEDEHHNLEQPMIEIMGLGLRKYNLERQQHFQEPPQLLLSDNGINNWAIPPVVKRRDGTLEIAPYP